MQDQGWLCQWFHCSGIPSCYHALWCRMHRLTATLLKATKYHFYSSCLQYSLNFKASNLPTVRKTTYSLLFLLLASVTFAQPLNQKKVYTHQDTLRGTITPEREWWDVTKYNIGVKPNYNNKTIEGVTSIYF